MPILESFVERGVIEWYADFQHLPDNDSNKVHGHLTIVPCDTLDLDVFQKSFVQFFVDGSQASVTNFGNFVQNSKWGSDWFPYMVHDEVYCVKKGLFREHLNYDLSICHSSDINRVVMYQEMYLQSINKVRNIIKFVERHGITQSVEMGVIPIQQINAYKTLIYGNMSDAEIRAWHCLSDGEMKRVCEEFEISAKIT